jgi:uncharacterized protein
MRILKHLSFLICFVFGTHAFAQSFPEPITPYVSDYANLMDPETEARINKHLIELREELDLELAVVTIETQFDYGDTEDFDEFTMDWFNAWGIGNAARNDGALILISRSDRAIRIELGSSYGPIFDDRMALVIEHHFLPYFKGEQYSAGIEAGTYESIKRLQPTYDISDPETLNNPTMLTAFKRTAFWRMVSDKLPIIVFIGIFAFLFVENRMRDLLVGLRRCPNCNHRQLHRKRTVEREPTDTERGVDVMETYCSSCDYHSTEQRSIPIRSDERARSGSGGFGGGRSSGGGATGRW